MKAQSSLRSIGAGTLREAGLRGAAVALMLVVGAASVIAQNRNATGVISTSPSTPATSTPQSSSPGAAYPDAPEVITLQDALARARGNNPEFLAATRTELGIAREDRVQARAALLPQVNYNNQYLYTQGNGGTPRFIANNGVREYISQANAHEELGGAQLAGYRRMSAALAVAQARAEMATRGLVVTVVQAYYGLVVTQRKYATAQQVAAEAERFLTISRNLENGGEVAHSDVIKAELQSNDRTKDLQEAALGLDKARLGLAVLLYSNFNQNFTVVDDLRLPEPLPEFPEIRLLAMKQNPELRVAAASLRVSESELLAARSGHLPTIAFDYWYGIDAPTFATRTDGVRNLGYGAQATVLLPIWNWGATQSKVKQADLRRQQAKVELSATQRELIARTNSFYREASIARGQLDLLRRSADLAAESLRLTTLRYQAGETTVLEVVDAQNAFAQARNAFDDGEARYRIAVATLQTLTGAF